MALWGAGICGGLAVAVVLVPPLRRELRKLVVGAVADFAKVSGPKDVLDFILNGLGNEFQKWFGHRDWIWDFMYRDCHYEGKMLDKSQQARYMRIKDLITELGPGGNAALLDVGCGTCNGLSIWREAGLGSFEGIDIANSAILAARAAHADVPNARFTTTSMQDYDSEGRSFDIIVFNESLYYVPNVATAVGMATKAATLLKPGGHLIISMSETHHSEKIWAALAEVLPAPKSKSQAKALEGNTWQVAAIQRPA
jgi:2-polyprenyl-3-methyl-5-hydroxy-6-metoxy-1,4-benzoquinol methylase